MGRYASMGVMARWAKVIRFPKSPPEPEPGFVEIRRCRDQSEALVVRGLLESEGIPVMLRSNLAQSVHPFSVGQAGEIIVLVRAADVAGARAALARP